MKPVTELTSAQTISVPVPAAAPAFSSVSHASHSSFVDEGRFIAGTLLAGRYRIVGLLGKGGMGEVYRATDLTLGQSVALKFLPAAATDNRFLLERFHGEVRIARQISHPNVCRVYDIGEVDGMPFISMEYIDGDTLAGLTRGSGAMPAPMGARLLVDALAGLSVGLVEIAEVQGGPAASIRPRTPTDIRQIVMLGARPEYRLNQEVAALAGIDRLYNAADDLPVSRLVALLERASGLVTVDSGPAHVAAAVGCPQVVLFGKASTSLYRPWGAAGADVRVLTGQVDGEPSMLGIQVEAVTAAWDSLALRTN